MEWIELLGWIEIAVATAIFLVIVLTVGLVSLGPHEDECEHGEDPVWCPECLEIRECG